MGNYVKSMELDELENYYDTIKKTLGSKIAECRQLAGYPKRTYEHSSKSGNILFKNESGQHLANNDTLEFYIELYSVDDKTSENLRELHKYAKELKKEIIRRKRGWT